MLQGLWVHFRQVLQTIQQHHIFVVESTNPTIMTMKSSHADDETYNYQFGNNYVPRNNRFSILQTIVAPVLPSPGIKPIKQVELYKKWWPFIPSQFRDEICPRPSDEVIASVKNDRNKKARDRTAKKRRGRELS